MKPIRTLDMFAGIGGFRSGLDRIGGFSFVGHCEIDKYANQAYEAIYQPKGELFYCAGEETLLHTILPPNEKIKKMENYNV